MTFYRNTGAPIPRDTPDGGLIFVPKGAVFEPTPREIKQFAYKIVEVGEEPKPTDVMAPAMPAPLPTLPPEWPLSMRPELYVKIHPEGKHAALARIILGLPPVTPEDDDGAAHE